MTSMSLRLRPTAQGIFTRIQLVLLVTIFMLHVVPVLSEIKPNIVFILVDDLDAEIGGQIPLVKTRKLIGDEGITFNKMYVSAPLCCPSRSSILTGKYVHNHGAVNNSISGNCSSTEWQKSQETKAFPVYLKQQGYKTFFAGKYLNQYGRPNAGGVKHIPPGWDWWIGLVGNSRYYNYSLSVNGTEEKHGDNYQEDYLTDLINRRATQFLQQQNPQSEPFFMMLSTPACHAPFTPAPQYQSNFSTEVAPRNGSYNKHGEGKHWLIKQAITPMPNDTVTNSDTIFRNRWRTLLSVDDMVENVITLLQKQGLLDNTYVFFTSDNGYHLGQFSLPSDKRQLYQFDVRVPFMVRGPKVPAGKMNDDLVMNIDLGPTFIKLAGQDVPSQMDGISLEAYLHPSQNRRGQAREAILFEHQGEYLPRIDGCPKYTGQNMANCDNHCVCEDSKNNSFSCLVYQDHLYYIKGCMFQDDVTFQENYDLLRDPYELQNIADEMTQDQRKNFRTLLRHMHQCRGKSCQMPLLLTKKLGMP